MPGTFFDEVNAVPVRKGWMMESYVVTRKKVYWVLMVVLVLVCIEGGAYLLERIENRYARGKNPFIEPVNQVPAFEIRNIGGVDCLVRTGHHPLMNPALQPFLLRKPPGGMRFFVVGGSAAAGWPYHVGDTSLSALLERKLRILYPNRQIEVINVSAGTYASHRVQRIMEEILRFDADGIFLYNGNNEFLESLVFRNPVPPSPWNHSALVRLLYRLTVRKPKVDEKGYDIQAQIPNTLAFAFSKASLYREDPAQFELLQKSYRFNIEKMVEDAKRWQVPLFILTCPVNLRDWVPNVSRHRKGMSPAELSAWTGFFRKGILSLEAGRADEAVVALRRAIEIDDEYAEAHYRLGKALLKLGKREDAKQAFIDALRRDAFPFRELPEFQAILKEVAQRHKVPVVDIVEALERVSRDGIIGLDLLVDYVHLSEKAQEIVAQQMLEALFRQGMLPGVTAEQVKGARIDIVSRFIPAREVAAVDLLYNMAMIMHQYEQIDSLYDRAIRTFERAGREDPSLAFETGQRIALLREIHPVVRAYRDLVRAEKLGEVDSRYTKEEARRIYEMYKEMIRQVKTPTLSREEFEKLVPQGRFK